MRLASEIRIQKCDRKNHIDNFNFLMIDDWIVSQNEMMCINPCRYRTFHQIVEIPIFYLISDVNLK